jgi:molybdenum cofactor biosynthesis enzyme MoaA
MKTHTFSIVVGTAACNAACPFCVSKMTLSEASKAADINWTRFNTACKVVEQARDGLVSVLLTGKGEPLLYPDQITNYLKVMDHRFPLIDLQTNGILIKDQLKALGDWRDLGLTLVCISIAHSDSQKSNGLMGIKDDFNHWDAVKRLHDLGLAVRLNCTMLKSGVRTPYQFDSLINQAAMLKVEQVTFREVSMPAVAGNHEIADFVKQEQLPGMCKKLMHHLELKGATRLLELPHGGVVYDYNGQNVALGNCLTGTTDPNDIRQIIFFPDGRIAYDWRYPGARIL